MRKFLLYLIGCICLATQTVLGQEIYQPSKVIPPSPTAAGLGAYGDVPVSYYSGTPNISVPLYEIKTNNHRLPITLSYNPTGVRVSQDASWVGLGWSLQAGGLITRSIRGIDDFHPSKGYYYSPELPENDGNNDPYITNENIIASGNYYRDVSSGVIDGDPDIFYYNFGEYSGRFVLGKKNDGSPIFISDRNNLKVTFSETGDGSWAILDPNGYKYQFGTVEKVESYYVNYDMPESNISGLTYFSRGYDEAVSAWYLDYIEAPNGEKIEFIYDDTSVQSLSVANKYQNRYDWLFTLYDQHYDEQEEVSLSNFYTYNSTSRQVIQDVYLQEILFKDGKIIFNTEDREDVEKAPVSSKPQRLSSVEIIDKGGTIMREFLLNHSYFNKHSVSNQYKYTHTRLKLDSITEYGVHGQLGQGKNPYIFTYFEPDNLPSKYTKKIDNWGFYNPSITNPVLFSENQPTLLPSVTTNSDSGMKTFAGADRKPDESGRYAKIGVLRSITYPTEGRTEFFYEPNEYYVSTPIVSTIYQTEARVVSYGNNNTFGEDIYIDDFQINSSTEIVFDLRAYATYADPPVSSSQNLAWLKNSSGNIIRSFSISNPSVQLSLGSGAYYLEVSQLEDHHVELTARTFETVSTNNKKGGGLRIAEIKNYDYDGKVIRQKKFNYTLDGTDEGVTSGKLLAIIDNYYTDEVWLFAPSANSGDVAGGVYLIRSSSSVYPSGFSTNTASIGYDLVVVSEGEDGEGGMTKHHFHNIFPEGFIVPEYPYLLDPLNGKLKEVEYLNNNGELKEKTEYAYTVATSTSLKGVKVYRHKPDPSNTIFYGDNEMNGNVKYYDNYSKWLTLTSKTTTKILGGQEFVINESFSYYNPSHMQVTYKTVIDSKNDTYTTLYRYPHDFSSTQPYTDMVNQKHIISPVIEEETRKNGSLLQTTKTNYYNWGNGVYAPQTVQSKYKSQAPETRMRFHAYDSEGKVLSVSRENDARQSYVWGYNKSYPVIMAENVSHSDLDAKVGQTLVEMGYSGGVSSLDSFLANIGSLLTSTQRNNWKNFNQSLRSKFPAGTNISTYTYLQLVGLTSETDANSISVYYNYDNFDRLKDIRDDNYHILETYDYHYKE